MFNESGETDKKKFKNRIFPVLTNAYAKGILEKDADGKIYIKEKSSDGLPPELFK